MRLVGAEISVLSLLMMSLHGAAALTHLLKFFLTGSSGVPNFPEFVVVGLLDEVEVVHYDSDTWRLEPRQDWMIRVRKDLPWDWLAQTQNALGAQQELKAYIEILKRRFNQTGERPSVSLLQKTPSSPVSCHATGFYPHRAALFWRKDGEELHEDVDLGEILPNHDGTFQMRVDLNLSSVPAEDWRRYDCVFQLSGVDEDIVTKLDKTRTNTEKPADSTSTSTFIIIAAAVLVIIAVVVLVIIAVRRFKVYRKRNAKPSSSSSASTEGSDVTEELNPKP